MKGSTYWKFFNALGRAVGVGFVVGGAVVGSWGFGANELIATLAGGIVALCGVLLLTARPFRPDLNPRDDEKA